MAKRIYLRRSRQDGKTETISLPELKKKLKGYYLNVDLTIKAMQTEWKNQFIATTGYFDYCCTDNCDSVKCDFCNGQGEKEINVDGRDCPSICTFCGGTGIDQGGYTK